MTENERIRTVVEEVARHIAERRRAGTPFRTIRLEIDARWPRLTPEDRAAAADLAQAVVEAWRSGGSDGRH